MGAVLVSCRDRGHARRHCLPPLKGAGWNGPVRLTSPGKPPPDLEGVAGILLTGGWDIHPREWTPAEDLHPEARPDEARDALEMPLVRAAWARGLPLLGLCRGAQVLNVALGGGLVQDVPSRFRCPRERHQHGSADDPGELHAVLPVPGTLLAGLLGPDPVPVNSRHHQAVGRIAPDLRACAHCPETRDGDDRLVEAVESAREDRWALGVQWHPEDLAGREDAAGEAARRLFAAFVARLRP